MYQGKKIGILGYGINNKSVSKWLLRQGASLCIIDSDKNKINQAKIDLGNDIKSVSGIDCFNNLDKFDIIVRSPGIPYLDPRIQQAKSKGVIITSQTKLFFEHFNGKIIGVTGTKGKGTTSTMISKMLTDGGIPNRLAGNIGSDPFGIMDNITDDTWIILELSSFQLQDMNVSPHIAVMLGVTSDHLDHHRSEAEYHNAKKNILIYQTKSDYCVACADNQNSRIMASITSAKLYWFSNNHLVLPGCYANQNYFVFHDENGATEHIAGVDLVNIPGRHILQNIAAAITVAKIVGVSNSSIANSISTFKSLPHRLFQVRTINKIDFYNDSYATGPDSTMAAISAFPKRKVIIIVGGSDKGADYSELGYTLSKSAKVIIYLGSTSVKISQAVKSHQFSKLPIQVNASNMQNAVELARQHAEPGDIVLLSPASASFDMFDNASHRGDEFAKYVNLLE